MISSHILPERAASSPKDQECRERSHHLSDLRAALALGLLFALSRAGAYAADVRFDAVPLVKYWQYVDPLLLRDSLTESLIHLHSQPPLFNLFMGLVLKLAPGWEIVAFAALFQLMGLLLCLALYALLRAFDVPRLAAVAVSAVFIGSPPSLLYENYLFYTYPVTAGVVVSALLLHRYMVQRRAVDGWAAFALLAAICLTRSVFHLGWLVAICVLLAVVLRGSDASSERARDSRWTGMAPALAALVVVVGFYLKNLILFGTFAASSWMGMNLASLALGPLYPEQRAAMIESGELSSLAAVAPFSPLQDYRDLVVPVEETGVPVLDLPLKANRKPNFNHLQYVTISKQYQEDALASLRSRPLLFLKSVLVALRIYLRPANEYRFLDRNRQAIRSWDSSFAMLHYGTPGFRVDYPERISGHPLSWYLARLSRASPAVVCIYLAALGFGFWTLLSALRSRSLDAGSATIVFMWGTLVWITAIGTTLEVGENNRFRYLGEPFALVLATLAACSAVGAWRHRESRDRQDELVR